MPGGVRRTREGAAQARRRHRSRRLDPDNARTPACRDRGSVAAVLELAADRP